MTFDRKNASLANQIPKMQNNQTTLDFNNATSIIYIEVKSCPGLLLA